MSKTAFWLTLAFLFLPILFVVIGVFGWLLF